MLDRDISADLHTSRRYSGNNETSKDQDIKNSRFRCDLAIKIEDVFNRHMDCFNAKFDYFVKELLTVFDKNISHTMEDLKTTSHLDKNIQESNMSELDHDDQSEHSKTLTERNIFRSFNEDLLHAYKRKLDKEHNVCKWYDFETLLLGLS